MFLFIKRISVLFSLKASPVMTKLLTIEDCFIPLKRIFSPICFLHTFTGVV